MHRRVVVTGIGMVSPVGLTRDTTWHNLLAGVSGIDTISSFDPEDLDTTIAGEVDGFDPTDHVSRKEARRMGPVRAAGGRGDPGGCRAG